MKKKNIGILAALVLFAASSALALSLDEAKTQGLVGEKMNGYTGAVVSSAEARALVDDINNRRRQEYERISSENGQPQDVVEKLAAEKLIGRLGAGQYYEDENGNWRRK